MFDAIKVKNDCVQWIRDWFNANGSDCKAVIGISGGKDSSVVAALCVEALGKDRVIGVLMPNRTQSDFNIAERVCETLDITYLVIDIGKAVDALRMEFTYDTTGLTISEQAQINLPPRIRMATLYMVSQTCNGRVACTDNLSESYIGYSTRWGDNVGDFSPLVNLTSDEVVAIGDACGLPYEFTHKTPSDGLCGKSDEDAFGFTYKQLNDYINNGTCGNTEIDKVINIKHINSQFKREAIPVFSPML